MKLYPFQERVLSDTNDMNRVAFYLDCGLGKTFVGSEKMNRLGAKVNLVICQKSKIDDWVEHFEEHYPEVVTFDLTNKNELAHFLSWEDVSVGIINYELAFRRPELAGLRDFTLMLDESSMIQNENAKRSRFILRKLRPKNVILLSGTPCSGKYEQLWSQLHLLGWDISKTAFWSQYVDYHIWDNEGFPIKIVKGYKNVERLKSKLREHGASFLKTEGVIDLPEQVFIEIAVPKTREYSRFKKDGVIKIKDVKHDGGLTYTADTELVGDTVLTKMLYMRMLCGHHNRDKLQSFRDLVQSTEDRLIVFYSFDAELNVLMGIAKDEGRPCSTVNGHVKDLTNYEKYDNSITFIQYQAGSMGLNLQKSNKIVYFTPPLSSELYEQSKKRTHRIGQKSSCFYYMLTCKGTIEERIYETLAMRKDYTDKLFKEDA